MLGHRGCRLGITYPEITEMQARAIFEAAIEAGKRTGQPVVPEVMVPLIAIRAEFDIVKERIDAGERPVIRFRVPEGVDVTFNDLVRVIPFERKRILRFWTFVLNLRNVRECLWHICKF